MADLLLRSVRRSAASDPVDVLIHAGIVTDVAPGLSAPGADVVEADGRWLIPGLWDEHVHMTQWALEADRLSLAGAASAAEAVALVGSAVRAAHSVGFPLVGSGFRDAVWPDSPSRAALDAVSGDVPVVLQSHDIHCVWLNSAAARWAGVTVDASGLLREAAAFAVGTRLNELPADVVDARVRDAGRAAAALGVVGLVDFEMAWNRQVWLRRLAGGFDTQRVEAAVYPEHLDRAAALGMRTGEAIEGESHDRANDTNLLRVGPLKVLIDGALNTRTAYCAHPYPDGSRGVLTVDPGELVTLMGRAAAAGLLPAIHAIGDAAITVALDAFEAAGVRGRVEHVQLVAASDVARFAALGVTPSVQPGHLLDDRDVAEAHWPRRTDRAFSYRSLLDTGATLAFGSDAPVARLDPWLAMRAAVSRAMPGDTPWHPEQRIGFAEALAASTRGRTDVRIGDAADLVLLDGPPERMAGESVAATFLGGRWTHRSF